jgi:hypothetical protein
VPGVQGAAATAEGEGEGVGEGMGVDVGVGVGVWWLHMTASNLAHGGRPTRPGCADV